MSGVGFRPDTKLLCVSAVRSLMATPCAQSLQEASCF